MERQTKTVTTPGGHEVVVKEFLTGREVDGVLKELFKDREAGQDMKVPMTLAVERNNKLIEAAIVSLDGSTENVFETIQDLPATEKAFILKEVQALAEGNF